MALATDVLSLVDLQLRSMSRSTINLESFFCHNVLKNGRIDFKLGLECSQFVSLIMILHICMLKNAKFRSSPQVEVEGCHVKVDFHFKRP